MIIFHHIYLICSRSVVRPTCRSGRQNTDIAQSWLQSRNVSEKRMRWSNWYSQGCPDRGPVQLGLWDMGRQLRYFKYELRRTSNNFDERKHGSSLQGHGMPLIPQQVTVARERANKDVTAARAREALLEGAAGGQKNLHVSILASVLASSDHSLWNHYDRCDHVNVLQCINMY